LLLQSFFLKNRALLKKQKISLFKKERFKALEEEKANLLFLKRGASGVTFSSSVENDKSRLMIVGVQLKDYLILLL